MDALRVLIVDDQDLVRAGFSVILQSEPGITVVGEARNGAEAVARVLDLRPDVVCMDVQMPVMDGLEAARRICAQAPGTGVLILTTFDRDDYLFDALTAGASGFLLKNSTPEKLIEAVQIIGRGDALLSPDVTRRVIERCAGRSTTAKAVTTALDDLTIREREVLGLLARGMSNAEIASTLYVGEATVKSHVSKVLQKLGLRDRVHAVVFAYEHGIVSRS
ncbi:MAG: response regulator transcription factor [Candidatus Saccharibacteria bacterium]|nr:response regulator transcription factor [Microbacteriaceae bacterium]